MLVPLELVEEILDYVGTTRALCACALVSKQFRLVSQKRLFTDVSLSLGSQQPEQLAAAITSSPHLALHVQSVHVTFTGARPPSAARARLFQHLFPRFTRLRDVARSGCASSVAARAASQKRHTRCSPMSCSRRDFEQLVRFSPALDHLCLEDCDITYPSGHSTCELSRISSLEIRPVFYASLLDTLNNMRRGDWTELRYLRVDSLVHLPRVQLFIDRCAELTRLHLKLRRSSDGAPNATVGIDIRRLTKLGCIHLKLLLGPTKDLANSTIGAVIRTLASAPRPSPIHTIILDVMVHSAVEDQEFSAWAELDELLRSPQWTSSLKTLVFSLDPQRVGAQSSDAFIAEAAFYAHRFPLFHERGQVKVMLRDY
uniref:F-box domain-containing protein n=1 Tax=Mycena chlorophos TaxID=658473 RepID=A0ABQ0LUW5_MYCCL|nr:predicted protein [Mycena chlorophos]